MADAGETKIGIEWPQWIKQWNQKTEIILIFIYLGSIPKKNAKNDVKNEWKSRQQIHQQLVFNSYIIWEKCDQ